MEIEITLIITIIVETHLILCAITRTGAVMVMDQQIGQETDLLLQTDNLRLHPTENPLQPQTDNLHQHQTGNPHQHQTGNLRRPDNPHQHQTFLLRPGPVLWEEVVPWVEEVVQWVAVEGEGVNSLPYFIKK